MTTFLMILWFIQLKTEEKQYLSSGINRQIICQYSKNIKILEFQCRKRHLILVGYSLCCAIIQLDSRAAIRYKLILTDIHNCICLLLLTDRITNTNICMLLLMTGITLYMHVDTYRQNYKRMLLLSDRISAGQTD